MPACVDVRRNPRIQTIKVEIARFYSAAGLVAGLG